MSAAYELGCEVEGWCSKLNNVYLFRSHSTMEITHKHGYSYWKLHPPLGMWVSWIYKPIL